MPNLNSYKAVSVRSINPPFAVYLFIYSLNYIYLTLSYYGTSTSYKISEILVQYYFGSKTEVKFAHFPSKNF